MKTGSRPLFSYYHDTTVKWSVCLLTRLERLEAGEGDAAEFEQWQAKMKKKDLEKQLEEIELRRLSGLLSQEEAIAAKQKLILLNKERVATMKAEVTLCHGVKIDNTKIQCNACIYRAVLSKPLEQSVSSFVCYLLMDAISRFKSCS